MANILYVSYYRDKVQARSNELMHCMKMNIANKHIDHIVVLLEGDPENFPEILNIDKLKIVKSPRPTFKDFFDIANIVSGPDDVNIISNTDIYFDESIALVNKVDMKGTCFALSRYHYYSPTKIELHNEKWSQDTWIFKGKIGEIKSCDFMMGIAGCDNRLAYEIHRSGYNIINPALSIRCIHYHLSGVINYKRLGTIQKPYLAVPVIQLPI